MGASVCTGGEGILVVSRDGGAKRGAHTVWPQQVESKRRGDVQKARRLRRAACQDGQSSLRRAAHPAGPLDVMPDTWNRSEHPYLVRF